MKTDQLIAKHLCHHIHSDLSPEHLTHIRPEDEDTSILAITFEVKWKAAWLSEDIVRSLPNGNSTIHKYRISKPPLGKKTRTAAQPLRLAYADGTPNTQPISPTQLLPI